MISISIELILMKRKRLNSFLGVGIVICFLSSNARAALVFQTNIYFPDIPTQVLSICEGQRPEDAVANFLKSFEYVSIESELNALDYIMTSLCNAIENFELHMKCTTKMPTPLVTVLDLAHLGQPVKTVYVRSGLDPNMEAECVCSYMECHPNFKKYISDAIRESASLFTGNTDNMSFSETQFSSSNLYEVLGLSPDEATHVSEFNIKQKYRELARRYHPDKNRNRVEWATEVFKNITNAYETLVDPRRRRQYDSLRADGDHQKHNSNRHSSPDGPQIFHFETSRNGGVSFGFTFTFGF